MASTPSTLENVEQILVSDDYPDTARMIDIGAFLLLAGGLFVPVVSLGFRTMKLIDTDLPLIFAGAAIGGLLAALARKRKIVVLCALSYSALFAFFIANYYDKIEKMKEQLAGNPFRGLAEAMVGLDWGCAVITVGVLAAFFSTAIARQAH